MCAEEMAKQEKVKAEPVKSNVSLEYIESTGAPKFRFKKEYISMKDNST